MLVRGKPPGKFVVYEQILQVPNYIVYDEERQHLRYFRLVNGRYEEQAIAAAAPLCWIPELNVGLGLWHGTYRVPDQIWLRWCDSTGNWLLTEAERERDGKEKAELTAEAERLAKEAAQAAQQKMAEYLRSIGLDPDNLPPI